jgi:Iap family predicted aminopeptidase
VRRRLFTTLVLVLLILLLAPTVVQAMTYDQAVNQLVKHGWPQAIEQKLMTFHSSSLGFRAAGTPADDAQARYIADVMQRIGLTSVHLEGVPVDEWNFKGASVHASGLGYANPVTYTASSFGGVVGTGAAGVTAPVVSVAGGSAAEFAAAGDVSGKIVLVDFESPMWWMSYPAMEAGLRGAKAVILTHSDDPDMAGYYDIPTALGCFDAESQLSAPPMVYISWNSGKALKDALATGAVTATVKNNATIRLAADGGKGYNVLGQIRGTRNPSQMVVYGSHHDAWFKGGLDNASAVVNELLTAKAMKMSGYHPKRTVLFFSTTGEEYGYTQSYYDWCIGAWHAITQRHPEWAGRITAYLNSELLGYKKGNLWMLASPEITPTLNSTLAASPDLTLTKNSTDPAVIGTPWCWNDQWTFTAAGVPSVCFWSQDNDYSGYIKTHVYHTQYDTPSQISWSFLGDISKYEFRVAKKYAGNSALLPYDLTPRVDDLSAALGTKIGPPDPADPDQLPTDPTVGAVIGKNIDAPVYDDFTAALGRFAAASGEYDSLASHGKLPAADVPSINTRLMKIEKLLNSNFTAMDWLDNTCYPFDQVTRDVYHMETAYDALDSGAPQYDTAATEISSVGLMWYGINFSEPVFTKELQRHRQSYYRICWGGQGHLAKYQNLMPDYNAVLAHDEGTAMGLLDSQIAFQRGDLQARIADMTAVFDEASNQIEDLLPPVATH